MTSLAQRYATTARYFAYARAQSSTDSPHIFLDSSGQAIKPSFRHIRVSCVAHSSLQLATISCQKQEPSQKELYDICVQKQILEPSKTYLFSAIPLGTPAPQSPVKQYKIFARELVDTQANPQGTGGSPRIYEDLSAQILIPLILLPLAQDKQVSGVFLLDDWLCVYDKGALLYECVCSDITSLRDALRFIDSMYNSPKTIFYYQDLFPSALDLHTLDSSLVRIESITKPLYQVLDDSLHSQRFTPLYNPHAKQLLQTSSFWQGLGLVACSALILALPFCKLLYASYLDSRASDLHAHNAQLTQTLKSQSLAISKLPHQNTQITDTIHHLYTIKSRYTSRLEILSTLSQIARKHETWITYLQINSGLEKGETLLEFSCQSQNQENLQTLLLSLQQSLNLEIISTEEELHPSDVFGTKITLKIGYA